MCFYVLLFVFICTPFTQRSTIETVTVRMCECAHACLVRSLDAFLSMTALHIVAAGPITIALILPVDAGTGDVHCDPSGEGIYIYKYL